MASMDWVKTTTRRERNIEILGFGAAYINGFVVKGLVVKGEAPGDFFDCRM